MCLGNVSIIFYYTYGSYNSLAKRINNTQLAKINCCNSVRNFTESMGICKRFGHLCSVQTSQLVCFRTQCLQDKMIEK